MLTSSNDFSIVCSYVSDLEEGLGAVFGPFIFFNNPSSLHYVSLLVLLRCVSLDA